MRKATFGLMLTLVAVLCVTDIGMCGYPEAAPTLEANSDAALTPQDFSCFPDFEFFTGDGHAPEFHIPDPEAVKRSFGKPNSIDDDGGFQMYYPFGWVGLYQDDGIYWRIEVCIGTDALEGPRGLRVGDSVETLLAAFHNEDAGLPMRSDEEGQISLFQTDTADEVIYQFAYAVYRGGEPRNKLVTIVYGWLNTDKREQRYEVCFEVGGGIISQIFWQVGDFHY